MSVKHKTKRKGKVEKISTGIVYITTSFNNIIVTITDQQGNTLSSCSAGAVGFSGAKKGTPFAAQMVAESAIKKAEEYCLKTVTIIIKGPGGGREAAMRAVNSMGLIVTMLRDVTSIPHNGCRKPKRRRV